MKNEKKSNNYWKKNKNFNDFGDVNKSYSNPNL